MKMKQFDRARNDFKKSINLYDSSKTKNIDDLE